MRKVPLFIIGLFLAATTNVCVAAVAIKKSSSVATTKQDAVSSVSSLVPTVVSLVGTVQQLTKTQKELIAGCEPTTQEIAFVDNTMKEWAKTGAQTKEEVMRTIGTNVACCQKGRSYSSSIMETVGVDVPDGISVICYDCFESSTDDGMIWYGYPKVGKVSYCSDGTNSCKNKKTASNIYDIFNSIGFGEADYTKQESTMAQKILSKVEQCSSAKLSAKKRAMWGEFLVGTINNVGQPTSTGTVMDSVSGIMQGGLSGGLSSFGSIATQLLEK